MRLKLKKGKQKELIRKYRIEQKITMNQLADLLGIKYGKLIAYFNETSLIPKEIYQALDKTSKYKKYLLEKKEENWGRIKGGRISSGNTKKIKIPGESSDLAEFYGIMLGDGNLTKLRGYKLGTYSIRIVGDTRKEKRYFSDYIRPLIKGLFDITPRISKFKNTNALYIEAVSKELVEFLEKKGFRPGNKIKNKLGIPGWIKQNPELLKKCLRGLYDTDGCVYKLTNQNSHQISFCSKNKTLLEEVRSSLIFLGINPSNITKGKEIHITKKSELANFLKHVGFSNSKHLNRIKMFKIAP